jgi:DNA-directed RNA polymerase specialized sigma subunit
MSKASKLDQFLKDDDKLYEEVFKKYSVDLEEERHVNEVAEILKSSCEKYGVPVINRDDIIEIMFELGRTIEKYGRENLKLATFAVLAVSRNLLK